LHSSCAEACCFLLFIYVAAEAATHKADFEHQFGSQLFLQASRAEAATYKATGKQRGEIPRLRKPTPSRERRRKKKRPARNDRWGALA
jgi:hypothetical protein